WGQAGSKFRWHPNAALNELGSDDFDTFVRNVVTHRPGYVSELFGWYATPAVDFVGRQEHLADDMIRVLRAMDVRFDEDRIRNFGEVGASPRPKKPIEWDPALRRAVERLEYPALVRYGYVPPPWEQDAASPPARRASGSGA